MATYTYSIALNTLNGLVAPAKLERDINNSSIVGILVRIDNALSGPDNLDVIFDIELSVPDQATLTNIVNNHDGVPITEASKVQRVEITQVDQDTAGLPVTNKFAPDGFYQRLHEIEYTTATMGGALHDKDINNVDTGWSSVKFFRDNLGVEEEYTPIDQADLDANCIRTDYSFMPNVDYMVKSGVITHQALWNVATEGEVYMWGKMLDVDPALNAFGIFPITVLDGGMAMSFVNPRDPVGLKGVNGTLLYYGGVMSPTGFIPTGDGMGTNRITFIMRHNAGMKQRFQAIFEIFKA